MRLLARVAATAVIGLLAVGGPAMVFGASPDQATLSVRWSGRPISGSPPRR